MGIIEVDGLCKSYGARQVLHRISFSVAQGEIVGILGPNGSGKTTTIECLAGLRQRDGGRISVDGMDPAGEPRRLRRELGMQLQQCRLPAKITVAEAVDLYRSFYADPHARDDLLDRFGLVTQRNTRFEQLSGGQQQRLSVALALVGRPRIAILDELTTGLDPAARREIWQYLSELRTEGMTGILVTHYLEEARHLCDRVVVIRDGRVVADDTPAALAATAPGPQVLSFSATGRPDQAALAALPGVADVSLRGGRFVITGTGDFAAAVIAWLTRNDVVAHELRLDSPGLDDAYLRLTDPEGVAR